MQICESSKGDGLITLTPANSKERFPVFESFMVKDRMLYGFTTGGLFDMQSVFLTQVYNDVVVVSHDTHKVVIRKKEANDKQSYRLACDIISGTAGKKEAFIPYGMKGTKVTEVANHGNVIIVERQDGYKFPVNTECLLKV